MSLRVPNLPDYSLLEHMHKICVIRRILQPRNTLSMPSLAILIADDDKASCLILRKILTDQGHSCTVVHDGVDAVQAACAKPFDFVFLDLYMPVLGGIHAAIAIRSLRSTSPVLVGIASTIDCKEVSLCRDVAGMAGVVLKPFDRESLPRLIQRLRRRPAPGPAHEGKTPEDTPRNTATVTEDPPAARSTLTTNERTSKSRRRVTNSCEPVRNLRSRIACTQPPTPFHLNVRNSPLPPQRYHDDSQSERQQQLAAPCSSAAPPLEQARHRL
jgi:CheY-like chemotaxis protein